MKIATLGLCALLVFTAAGCDTDDEITDTGHTPVSAKLFVGGTDVSGGLTIPAAETVRVEVRYLDDHGDVITGIEDGHIAELTFTPATLASTAAVTGHNFQTDVTATGVAGAAGQVTVGYGHHGDDPELTFGPFPVTIQ